MFLENNQGEEEEEPEIIDEILDEEDLSIDISSNDENIIVSDEKSENLDSE